MCLSSCRRGAETYLIAPSLKLVNSRHTSTREDGLWRIFNWHGGDSTLPAIIEKDGIEALLSALPHVKDASRVAILEMLLRMVPLDDGKARMLKHDAAGRAAAACAKLERNPSLVGGSNSSDPAAAERCSTLATALAQALHAAQPAASAESSSSN